MKSLMWRSILSAALIFSIFSNFTFAQSAEELAESGISLNAGEGEVDKVELPVEQDLPPRDGLPPPEDLPPQDGLPPKDGMLQAGLPFPEKNGFDYGSAVHDFFFDVTRYALTGKSQRPDVVIFASISKEPAGFYMLPFWENGKGIVYLYEKCWPEKKGIIQQDKISINADDSWLIEADKKIEEKIGSADEDELENKPSEAEAEKLPEEVYRTSRDGTIRRFTFDGEQFSVNSLNGITYLTKASDNKVVRKTYDPQYILVKKETFNNPQKSEDLKLLDTIQYEYNSEQKLSKTKEEDFENKREITSLFDEKTRLVEKATGHFETQKKTEIFVDDSLKKWSYDENDRLVSVSTSNFSYTKNRRGKTEKSTEVLLYKYVYTEKSSQPDEYFYENEKLRVKNIALDEKKSSRTMYFDEDFSIYNEYDDGFKTLEIYYLKDVEMRRKYYEKTE